MPPEAIEATRCSTSIGMPAAWALAMKVSAIAASAMLMPPEAEPVMPASAVTVTASLTSGFGIAQRVGDDEEAGQGGDHRAEAVLGCGVHRSQQGAADGGLAAFGETRGHRLPGEQQHAGDADQQGAFHRPDRGHLGNFLHDRRGAADHRRHETRGSVP
jgi:hypothetical protein